MTEIASLLLFHSSQVESSSMDRAVIQLASTTHGTDFLIINTTYLPKDRTASPLVLEVFASFKDRDMLTRLVLAISWCYGSIWMISRAWEANGLF